MEINIKQQYLNPKVGCEHAKASGVPQKDQGVGYQNTVLSQNLLLILAWEVTTPQASGLCFPPSLMLLSFSHWGTSVGGSGMWLTARQLLRQQWLYFEECRASEKSGAQETKSKTAGPWLLDSYL